MSQGCNFINSLMSASRRRSASVTPQAPQTKTPTEPTNNSRRASSSDDLVTPLPANQPLAQKSSSGNHLTVCVSNETICDQDSTQTNRPILINSSGYVQLSSMNMRRPLQIEVNDAGDTSLDKIHGYSIPESVRHPVSLDDILQIDLNESRLEDERRNLENLVEIWEQKVDELERKRFADDVPRTLIEKVLKQRKELRDLECQLYKIDLEESLDKVFPYCSSHKSYESQMSPMQDEFGSAGDGGSSTRMITTGRSGSHLRPGQENTAEILEAIPPASSLQYKQYLSRASTGTDSSEYSQLPIYDAPHKHLLQTNETNQRHKHHVDHRHHHYRSHTRQQHSHEQQIYVQLDSPEISRKPRSSPIRPNYFKDDFKSAHVIVTQDSSSTTSSSSPH